MRETEFFSLRKERGMEKTTQWEDSQFVVVARISLIRSNKGRCSEQGEDQTWKIREIIAIFKNLKGQGKIKTNLSLRLWN